ncbi:MAG: nodulation protein NfeD [Dehalococcoidales bacterium]|nr:nodulation protein NfeD [Dehalococcoidales bacterium]
MFKKLRIIFLFSVLLAAVLMASGVQAQASGSVYVLTIKGTINPVLVDYVDRGIQAAEENNASALIIQLDTPGGLDTAMRDIVKLMVNAYVSVVVYVSPSGSRAASAGVFITMASHVAAMAPNTAIGAAHPVSIGEEGEEAMSETMEEKVLNDAAAYIRSLAESHGRNIEWAEKAVRESVSATENEALELNVIDLIAYDLNDLLAQLDGREVELIHGQIVTLHTAGATVIDFGMTGIENFLYTIADPNIAYLLLSIATLGIMAEIFNPGLIFPGIVGGISLLLAFYSLGVLPVNYAGILLIVLAIGLFIGEVLTTTFGLFTAGGVISLVAGSLMLFKGAAPEFQINPWLIAGVCIVITAALAFLVQRAISAHRKQAVTGREELVGKTALVKVALNPEGTIFYKGENWTAISESGKITAGEKVVIKRIDGLLLYVVKQPKEPAGKKSKR